MTSMRSAAAISLAALTSLGISQAVAAPSASVAALRAPAHADDVLARLAAPAFGRSGKLRVIFSDAAQPLSLPFVWNTAPPGDVSYAWEPTAGTQPRALLGQTRMSLGVQTPAQPGIWRLRLHALDWSQTIGDLELVTRVPFADKENGMLNGYRIGRYVTEGAGRLDQYAPPPGFIEVTPANQDTYISEHFRLRDFLTKDQFSVWPKYLALDLRLIDKLELVLQELNGMGIRADRMTVMSGFRTPAYNIQGVGEGGRALLSRHTYGDASDVWIDNDANGYMDDLNEDGTVDTRDADVILRAVERVEAKYPELTGGCGVYRDSGAHGPFVHIDTRGTRARW